ncbi:hypothetical protein NDU88_002104 [Pleurodeles waltl]|uniref:Uncharacterized protein n=1 Tax=Pleurodeles waltl TaxID=8319 RepID=A0AAV7P5T7_PLEWA|nr:hypothetical protein NDU88_002104 [Pleurodeles waltl]
MVACKVVTCCGHVGCLDRTGFWSSDRPWRFSALPPTPVKRTLSLLESGGSRHKSPELLGIYLGASVGPELGWGRKPCVEESPN